MNKIKHVYKKPIIYTNIPAVVLGLHVMEDGRLTVPERGVSV